MKWCSRTVQADVSAQAVWDTSCGAAGLPDIIFQAGQRYLRTDLPRYISAWVVPTSCPSQQNKKFSDFQVILTREENWHAKKQRHSEWTRQYVFHSTVWGRREGIRNKLEVFDAHHPWHSFYILTSKQASRLNGGSCYSTCNFTISSDV